MACSYHLDASNVLGIKGLLLLLISLRPGVGFHIRSCGGPV